MCTSNSQRNTFPAALMEKTKPSRNAQTWAEKCQQLFEERMRQNPERASGPEEAYISACHGLDIMPIPVFKSFKGGCVHLILNKSSAKAVCSALQELTRNVVSVLSVEQSELDGECLAGILQSLPPDAGRTSSFHPLPPPLFDLSRIPN
jgi:hypothetical protein